MQFRIQLFKQVVGDGTEMMERKIFSRIRDVIDGVDIKQYLKDESKVIVKVCLFLSKLLCIRNLCFILFYFVLFCFVYKNNRFYMIITEVKQN